MPRIRILTSIAGDGFSYRRGEVVDVPGELAGQWCDGVRAELVRDQAPETPERAADKPERAVRARQGKPRPKE